MRNTRRWVEPLLRLATELLARRFVSCSRFDPLHNPDAEQALYDRLPDWFSRLARDGDLTLTLEMPGGTFDATVSALEFRTQMALACEPLLQRLRLRVAERGPHLLQVHARLAEVPGIIDGLRRLPDTVVHVLPPGAAAQGLVGSGVVPGVGHLVVELPWDDGPADFSTPPNELSAPSASVPTHLLMGHQLYRLGPQPFRIGSALGPDESGIALDPAVRGLSRQHCTLRLEQGALFVFDHSRFGTRLNGHRIDGTAMLQPGDSLSLGSPPIELRLLIEGDVNGT
ncbi:MAG: FHA domain-containing protein [Gammaproteobacteria bacterium]